MSIARRKHSSTSPGPARMPSYGTGRPPPARCCQRRTLLRESMGRATYVLGVGGPAAGTVASHTARALTDLGDHVGTERQHRVALNNWDPVKYKRVHILTHADLGDSLAAQARADEAVGAWAQALDLTNDMASDRTRKAITSIRPTLAIYSKRGVPGAAELNRRAYEASR